MGDAPITVVTGSGRCGSSLVMRILEALQIPPGSQAEPPYYEDRRLPILMQRVREWQFPVCKEQVEATNDLIRDLLRDHIGGAIKPLYPMFLGLPKGPAYNVVILRRDPLQQARSHLKFGRHMGNDPPEHVTEEKLVHRIERQDGWIEARAKALGARYTILRFEDLVERPRQAITALCAFLEVGTSEAELERGVSLVFERGAEVSEGIRGT